jgi:hypothetical protein
MGWLGLGNTVEARAELGHISLEKQAHPDVLEVLWLVCADQKNWEEALQAAGALVEAAPERVSGWLHRAYALRRVPQGGLQAAWDCLLPCFAKFPKEAIIAFNLACYACQLKQPGSARTWLQRAIALGNPGQIKEMALGDADLEPMWEEIRSF